MKKQSKKTLALLLATLLVVGLFPIAGFAAEGDEPATPSSVEAPQATPTPTPESPVTPGPTETPLPTPATNSSIDVSGLSGEELYAYLKTLEGDALKAVLTVLTEQQIASLQGYATQTELAAWFSQALDFTKMTAAEIADYLRGLESNQARIDAWIELFTILDAEKIDAVAQEFTEEEFTKLFSVTGTLIGAGVAEEDFSNAGALLTSLTAPASAPKLKSMARGFTTLAEPDTGIQLNKSVSLLPNGNYKIRLESYTTGTVTNTTEVEPADIVLVLDVSHSMGDDFSSETVYTFNPVTQTTNSGIWDQRSNLYFNLGNNTFATVSLTRTAQNGTYTYSYTDAQGTVVTKTSSGRNGLIPLALYRRTSTTVTTTRLEALQAAVNNFIDSTKLQNESIPLAANKHRIALVAFSDEGDILSNLTTVDAAGASTLKNIVDGLDPVLYTRSDLGMTEANNIITGTSSTRNQVVVMFTDGVPTSNSTSFSDTVANAAIAQSKLLKGKEATVYTVGIFEGAQVNAGGALPGTSTETNKANRYMHLTSSNYPNATNMSTPGTGGATGTQDPATGEWSSYYLSASNAGALDDVFQEISHQVGNPTVKLGTEARIKDTISAYFRLTTPSNITVKTADASYTGGTLSFVNETVVPLTPTVSGKTVTVSGFDFDTNYVSVNGRGTGNTFHGKKLIIEIEVQREPSFIGGNNVETNVPATSGLYDNATAGAPRQMFGSESPEVNVPILFSTASLQNKDIYAGDDVILTSLFGGNYTTSTGGSTYTLGNVVTNQYSDVAYTIKDGGTVIGTYTVPAGSVLGSGLCEWTGANTINDLMTDKTYTVTAAITPSETATNAIGTAGSIANLNIGSASVNVYKPAITPQDLSVYLTQNPTTAQLNTAAIANVAWKHGADTANTATMGAAPGLTYTFSGLPASPAYPTTDTGVTIASVTRTDGDLDVLTSASTITKTTAAPVGSHLKLFVLKPTITCTDTSVFLGDTTNLTGRYSSITWTGTTGAPAVAAPFATAPTVTVSPVKVTGTAPGSDLTVYKPAVTSTFKVKAAIGGVDITTLCKIINNFADVTSAAQHFTVTVVSGQVTITKTGGAEGESYIFTLTSDTGITVKEVIQGNGSKVIKGLPKGTYTVTEETAWSWRYDATPAIGWTGNDRTLGQTMTDTAISCSVANTNRVPFWLSGESFAVNRFNPYTPAV